MDPTKTGHPRTLSDHQDWRMRGVQRQSGQDTSIVSRQERLKIGLVTQIDPRGNVQLDVLSDEDGQGPFLRCLNFAQCYAGDVVVWGYVEGSPVVLGPLTSDIRPWRIPGSGFPDTLFLEEFEIGNTLAQGNAGLARWAWTLTGGGSVALGAGNARHPGIFTAQAGAAIGDAAYAHPLGVLFPSESLGDVEFMVQTAGTVAGVLFEVGIADNPATPSSGIVCRYDTSTVGYNAGWSVARFSGGVGSLIGEANPVVPLVVDNWYKITFRRLAAGSWFVHVVNGTADPIVEGIILAESVPSFTGVPFFRTLSRSAVGTKSLVADYVSWSRRLLGRR